MKSLQSDNPDVWMDDGVVTTEVLQDLKDGKSYAYELVYLHWNEPVKNLVNKITRSSTDAEDITHDIFLLLWERRKKIEPTKKIRSLLYILARNISMQMFRDNKRTAEFLKDYNYEDVNRTTSADLLIEKESALLVEVALSRLPDHMREIYEMSAKGMTAREIADQLDIKVETVYQKLSRSRRALVESITTILIILLRN